jgi:predicted TPR repeat methyltransferase
MDDTVDDTHVALQQTQLYPDDPESWYVLGFYQAKHGRYDASEKTLAHGLTLSPHHAGMLYQLGLVCMLTHRLQEARSFYEQAYQYDCYHPPGLCHGARCYALLGDFTTANDWADQAMALHAKEAPPLKIWLALQVNHLAEAHDIASCHPNHTLPVSWLYRLAEHCWTQERTQAVQYYQKIIHHMSQTAYQPIVDVAHFRLGEHWMLSRQWDYAVYHFTKGIPHDPAAAHTNLGTIWYKCDQPLKAIEHYQEALKHNPKQTTAYFRLACLDTQQPVPPEAPLDYITHLFNQYATGFDHDLLRLLKYNVPTLLYLQWQRHRVTDTIDCCVDLGCGTGLAMVPFRHHIKHSIGIDVSSEMLALARQKMLYDTLHEGDWRHFLQPNTANLLLAADSWLYCGDWQHVVKIAHNGLCAGGMLLATCEAAPRHVAEWVLQDNGRYQHSKVYLERVFKEWSKVSVQACILRYHHNKPVTGYTIVAWT